MPQDPLVGWVEEIVRQRQREEGILQGLANHIKKGHALVSFPGCVHCCYLRRTCNPSTVDIYSCCTETLESTLAQSWTYLLRAGSKTYFLSWRSFGPNAHVRARMGREMKVRWALCPLSPWRGYSQRRRDSCCSPHAGAQLKPAPLPWEMSMVEVISGLWTPWSRWWVWSHNFMDFCLGSSSYVFTGKKLYVVKLLNWMFLSS